MVYGKELGEFVNVHKLQREDNRRRRMALCESSVVYFWQNGPCPGNQMAEYTMLYFERSRPDRPRKVPRKFSLTSCALVQPRLLLKSKASKSQDRVILEPRMHDCYSEMVVRVSSSNFRGRMDSEVCYDFISVNASRLTLPELTKLRNFFGRFS